MVTGFGLVCEVAVSVNLWLVGKGIRAAPWNIQVTGWHAANLNDIHTVSQDED